MARSSQAFAGATFLLVVVAVVLLVSVAPTEAVCNMSNEQFTSCQPAATKTTDPAMKPSDACCTALRGADLNCLCTYKNSPWMAIYNIDSKRAMELPAKCGLAMPSNC